MHCLQVSVLTMEAPPTTPDPAEVLEVAMLLHHSLEKDPLWRPLLTIRVR